MKTTDHTGTHDQLRSFALYLLGQRVQRIREQGGGYPDDCHRIAENIDANTRALVYEQDDPGHLLHELEVCAWDWRNHTGRQDVEECVAHLRHAYEPEIPDPEVPDPLVMCEQCGGDFLKSETIRNEAGELLCPECAECDGGTFYDPAGNHGPSGMVDYTA